MTDKPENVELADAQYRHKLTRDIHARAAELREAIEEIDAAFLDPATSDVHAILWAALGAADRPLERAVRAAHLEVAYLTGEMQRPQPTVRHRDAITGQYVDADEAAARPETTVRETRKLLGEIDVWRVDVEPITTLRIYSQEPRVAWYRATVTSRPARERRCEATVDTTMLCDPEPVLLRCTLPDGHDGDHEPQEH